MSTSAPVRSSLEPYAVHPVQQYLIDAADKWPSKIAIIDGDRRFTFGDITVTDSPLPWPIWVSRRATVSG